MREKPSWFKLSRGLIFVVGDTFSHLLYCLTSTNREFPLIQSSSIVGMVLCILCILLCIFESIVHDNFTCQFYSLSDFVRPFTLDKRLEMIVKKAGRSVLPTVVYPDLYRRRFVDAMDRYFSPIPDKWTGLGADIRVSF